LVLTSWVCGQIRCKLDVVRLRVITYVVTTDTRDVSDVRATDVASDTSNSLAAQGAGSSQSAGICASALLRAASALSLTDGPCSLSCRDFLAEVSEQVRDLAAAASLQAPTVSLWSYPVEATAGDVRWPIAAAPRNKASLAAACGSPVSKPPSVCPSTTASTRSLTPPEVDRQRRPRAHRDRRVQSAGNGRRHAMPADLSGLAKVLTGGAVGGAVNASPPRRGHRQRRRESPNFDCEGFNISPSLDDTTSATAPPSASFSAGAFKYM